MTRLFKARALKAGPGGIRAKDSKKQWADDLKPGEAEDAGTRREQFLEEFEGEMDDGE